MSRNGKRGFESVAGMGIGVRVIAVVLGYTGAIALLMYPVVDAAGYLA